MSDVPRMVRPPVPRPRWQHDADRARELIAAIHDYSKDEDFMVRSSEVAFEWFDELHELAVRHLEPQPDFMEDE